MRATLRDVLGKATVKGPEDPKNIGRLFTVRFLGSHSDLSMIRPEQWSACPLPALKGIDRDAQLASIPAESMVHWRDDMTQAIDPKVMMTLNKDQARKIGSNVPPEQSPLNHLLRLHNLDPETRAILQARRDGQGHWRWIRWVLLGIGVAILIVAPVIYYFVTRRPHGKFQ
jgi:hypothetical protein